MEETVNISGKKQTGGAYRGAATFCVVKGESKTRSLKPKEKWLLQPAGILGETNSSFKNEQFKTSRIIKTQYVVVERSSRACPSAR